MSSSAAKDVLTPAEEIRRLNAKGIILSGGPASVYARGAPQPDTQIFELGIPLLGICYGLQIVAHFLGGKVERGDKREFGKGQLTVKDNSSVLFKGLPASFQVWNSHGDKLTKLPLGFVPIAVTENSRADFQRFKMVLSHIAGKRLRLFYLQSSKANPVFLRRSRSRASVWRRTGVRCTR